MKTYFNGDKMDEEDEMQKLGHLIRLHTSPILHPSSQRTNLSILVV